MEFPEFKRVLLEKCADFKYEEDVVDESFTIRVKCGNITVTKYTLIKCRHETASDVRQLVYDSVLHKLHDMGIEKILEKCKK